MADVVIVGLPEDRQLDRVLARLKREGLTVGSIRASADFDEFRPLYHGEYEIIFTDVLMGDCSDFPNFNAFWDDCIVYRGLPCKFVDEDAIIRDIVPFYPYIGRDVTADLANHPGSMLKCHKQHYSIERYLEGNGWVFSQMTLNHSYTETARRVDKVDAVYHFSDVMPPPEVTHYCRKVGKPLYRLSEGRLYQR